MSLTFLGMPAGPGRASTPTTPGATADSASSAGSVGSVGSADSAGSAHTGGWRTTVEIPDNTLRWGESFPAAAHQTLQNTQLRRNLGHATRTIRNKRAVRVEEMPDWEELRRERRGSRD